MTELVDELANELRQYRHSPMASGALAEHILAIPRIADALKAWRFADAMVKATGGGVEPFDPNAVSTR